MQTEFLSMLANDIEAHFDKLEPFTLELKANVDKLVKDVEVDLSQPLIEGDD
jgi:antitoxin PrlF